MVKMYSLKDTKGQIFNVPLYQRTHGEAERFCTTILKTPPAELPGYYKNMAEYPHDFDLYFIGTFNEDDGKIQILDAPQHLINCDSLKAASN